MLFHAINEFNSLTFCVHRFKRRSCLLLVALRLQSSIRSQVRMQFKETVSHLLMVWFEVITQKAQMLFLNAQQIKKQKTHEDELNIPDKQQALKWCFVGCTGADITTAAGTTLPIPKVPILAPPSIFPQQNLLSECLNSPRSSLGCSACHNPSPAGLELDCCKRVSQVNRIRVSNAYHPSAVGSCSSTANLGSKRSALHNII